MTFPSTSQCLNDSLSKSFRSLKVYFRAVKVFPLKNSLKPQASCHINFDIQIFFSTTRLKTMMFTMEQNTKYCGHIHKGVHVDRDSILYVMCLGLILMLILPCDLPPEAPLCFPYLTKLTLSKLLDKLEVLTRELHHRVVLLPQHL